VLTTGRIKHRSVAVVNYYGVDFILRIGLDSDAMSKALDRAVAICGSQQKLADRLGLRQAHISMWKHRGNVPAEYCPSIERVTGGLVKCEHLRPDVEWAVLREQAA
jgi:DNA-binding transcriptional regulator YdaS (Cro superfamily)